MPDLSDDEIEQVKDLLKHRDQLVEMQREYERRQWLFRTLKSLSLWITALAAGIIILRQAGDELINLVRKQ